MLGYDPETVSDLSLADIVAGADEYTESAAREMVRGRYAGFFWTGVVLLGLALATPWVGGVGAVAALAGLLAHEHAYVQAGQSVPLA